MLISLRPWADRSGGSEMKSARVHANRDRAEPPNPPQVFLAPTNSCGLEVLVHVFPRMIIGGRCGRLDPKVRLDASSTAGKKEQAVPDTELAWSAKNGRAPRSPHPMH